MVNFGIENGMPSWSCKGWIYHHLPKQYLQSAYLNIDVKCFSNIETISTNTFDVIKSYIALDDIECICCCLTLIKISALSKKKNEWSKVY